MKVNTGATQVQRGTMERCCRVLLLLWWTTLAAMTILRSSQVDCLAVKDTELVRNLSGRSLQVLPHSDNSSTITKLVIEGGLITLNEADRVALASYPALEELHLDGNLVSSIPARYFSVVPHLRVLSLSANRIRSLDPEAFSGLDALTRLDLSHNLLTSLHIQLFRQLQKLQVLNLKGNPWNCSCLLLNSTGKAAGVSTGGSSPSCASLENQEGKDLLQATAVCLPSTPPTVSTDYQRPEATGSSTTKLETIPTSPNHIRDPTPAVSHTWKFTVCVAALALCTATLIVCAIKGPSLYKLCHDYRHQRLHAEADEEEEEVVPTVFSGAERYIKNQTFTFEQGNGQVEMEENGEEDEYFEDPYIRREE